MKILVTGACGYIGSHTLVSLLQSGFEVVSVDDNSRSNADILRGVQRITGKTVTHYSVNMCQLDDLVAVFAAEPLVVGVIHFAAYKWVGESVEQPLLYYHNNMASLLNLLHCVQKFGVLYHVFSSSCSVYGNPAQLPVTELTPMGFAESPYAATKQMGERIVTDFARTATQQHPHRHVLLRYFNPVGAHPSAYIGEVQPVPQNLVPYITQTAMGWRPQLAIFGSDYDTPDGTCLRDYIHVSDIADAHTLALQYLMQQQPTPHATAEVFNLGLGKGATVLEVIAAFERSTQQRLPYRLAARRAGDVAQIYADNTKAQQLLNWQPRYTLDDMMQTAWAWQQQLTRPA